MDILYNLIMQVALDSTRLLRYYEHMQIKESTIKILTDDFSGGKGGDEVPPQYKDGSFRIRPNGIFEYRFMHLDKQISVYGKTKDVCYQKRTDIIAGKKKVIKNSVTFTYAEWLKKWFTTYKEPYNGKSSLRSISDYMEKRIIPELGRYRLKQLTPLILQDFINKYRDIPNTQHKIADVVRSSLEKARINRLIKFNPFEGVILVPHTPKHYPVFQLETQRILLENITDNRYKFLFFFSCCTGMRIGEALTVKCEDIDKSNHIINIIKTKTRTKGESRVVPYLPELFNGVNINRKGLLFNITFSGARNYFTRLFEKLKIDGTLHSTRHTFISCCYHIGIKDKQIQKWAGHSTIEMTLNTYTHLLKNDTSPILDYLIKLKETLGI